MGIAGWIGGFRDAFFGHDHISLRADAVIADKAFLDPIVNESGGELSFVGDSVLIGGGIGMGIRKSDSDLKDKFNAAINSMKADGTLNNLIKQWEIGELF
mgnify:CR=1 FL=1